MGDSIVVASISINIFNCCKRRDVRDNQQLFAAISDGHSVHIRYTISSQELAKLQDGVIALFAINEMHYFVQK